VSYKKETISKSSCVWTQSRESFIKEFQKTGSSHGRSVRSSSTSGSTTGAGGLPPHQGLALIRVDSRLLKQSPDLNRGFQQFLVDAHAGLDVKVSNGDVDQLVSVLEAMLLIRTRAPTYEKLINRRFPAAEDQAGPVAAAGAEGRVGQRRGQDCAAPRGGGEFHREARGSEA
jgi:hypothetical protein